MGVVAEGVESAVQAQVLSGLGCRQAQGFYYAKPGPPERIVEWLRPGVAPRDATGAAVLGEVIVLGYLVTRLQQVGWTPIAAVIGSAVLRGGYHLYQGWGGFAGNLLMGLLFGLLFLRWRRTWPFVIAHLLLDFAAGAGYLLFRHHLPGF